MEEKKIEELQEEIDKLKNEMNEKYDKINNQVERLGELFFDFVQNQLSKNIAKNEEINYLTRQINKIDDAMLKNRFEFIDLSSDVLKLKKGNK